MIIKKSHILFGFLLILSFELCATEGEASTEHNDYYAIQSSVSTRIHELEFLDRALENSIMFRPNVPYILQVGLSFNEQKIVLEKDDITGSGVDKRKGKSSFIDIHYTGFFNKAEYSAYYGRYEGFYVSGQKDVNGDYFVFNDIKTKRYGFEYKAFENEPQMISVNNRYANKYSELPDVFGALTYGFILDVSYIKNIPGDPAILSQIKNSQFLFFNNLRLITLSPLGGALARISLNGLFLEGGVNVGFGVQKQEYDLNGINRSKLDYSLAGNIFITMGSVTPLGGVFGLAIDYDSVEPLIDGNEFSIATLDVSIFYRLRF